MKIYIDTEANRITIEGEMSERYHPQSPVGTAVRLLVKLLAADKAINFSLIKQRIR